MVTRSSVDLCATHMFGISLAPVQIYHSNCVKLFSVFGRVLYILLSFLCLLYVRFNSIAFSDQGTHLKLFSYVGIFLAFKEISLCKLFAVALYFVLYGKICTSQVLKISLLRNAFIWQQVLSSLKSVRNYHSPLLCQVCSGKMPMQT